MKHQLSEDLLEVQEQWEHRGEDNLRPSKLSPQEHHQSHSRDCLRNVLSCRNKELWPVSALHSTGDAALISLTSSTGYFNALYLTNICEGLWIKARKGYEAQHYGRLFSQFSVVCTLSFQCISMLQNLQVSHWSVNQVQQQWVEPFFLNSFPIKGKKRWTWSPSLLFRLEPWQALHHHKTAKTAQDTFFPFPSTMLLGWELRTLKHPCVPPELPHRCRLSPWFLLGSDSSSCWRQCCITILPVQYFAPTLPSLWASEGTRWETGQAGNEQRLFSLTVWYFPVFS